MYRAYKKSSLSFCLWNRIYLETMWNHLEPSEVSYSTNQKLEEIIFLKHSTTKWFLKIHCEFMTKFQGF